MKNIESIAHQKGLVFGQLTLGEICELASETGHSAGEIAIIEAAKANNISEDAVGKDIWRAFEHNLTALSMGLEDHGHSFLFGQVAHDMGRPDVPDLTGNPILDKAVRYTLATQVGNHCVGLRPCAGTGDPCPYTGLARALKEEIKDEKLVLRALAILLKIGTLFRVAKVTTGCNLEGFGAGAAGTAAALSEIWNAGPENTAKAVVLALSPTIAVPCTPRVMVPGLCATHIGGAIMIGWLASFMARHSHLPVNVPVDVMLSMASAVHPISGKQVVPTVIRYMEPFFKVNEAVESYVDASVKAADAQRRKDITAQALLEAKAVAARASSIIHPFGDVIVGGSSQAVGSPANTARIAHHIASGKITKIVIELYPELFARRAINVPSIVMCGVYGSAPDDAATYKTVMERVKADRVQVEIKEIDEYQVQKITLETTEQGSMVKALNRGGARLVLTETSVDKMRALQVAQALGIVVVDA